MNVIQIWENLPPLLSVLSTGALLGHNLWLLGPRLRPAPPEKMRLEINTSDLFPASETAVTPDRIADFAVIAQNGDALVLGFHVEGSSLIAEIAVEQYGPLLAALTLHPRGITLEGEKFTAYLADEAAASVLQARESAGQALSPGREIYTKYAKVLVPAKAGSSELHRRVVGHRLEILPQADPCTLPIGGRLPVQVRLDGKAAEGLRVSSGGEGLQNGAYVAHAVTDRGGFAEIEIPAAPRCYLRAHCIRPHSHSDVADWESLWASITFSRIGF